MSAAGMSKKREERSPAPSPEPRSLQAVIEEAYARMDARLHASFEAAHADLANQFAESQSRDKAFLESISTTTSMLAAPLDKELIETTVIQEGRPVTEIMEMGKRIMQFKRIIEKNEAELKEYWKQWDDLQDEYLELGIEIFGPEAFGGAADEARETGYKKEMEILDIEHNAAINELMSEVEKVSEQMLTKMKESEKEWDEEEDKIILG